MEQKPEQLRDDHVMTETEKKLFPLEWREAVISSSLEDLVQMGYTPDEILSGLKSIQENIKMMKYLAGLPTDKERVDALDLALIEGLPPRVVVGDRDDVTLVEGNDTVH